ncbi:MAG: hypothetical protein AAF389_16405 [Gemmatimonadota bacterium]
MSAASSVASVARAGHPPTHPALLVSSTPLLQWTTPAVGGELVQGMYRGRWLHVAAPIDRFRWAVALADGAESEHSAWTTRVLEPARDRRSWRKVRAGLAHVASRRDVPPIRVALGGAVLSRGVGMGSSTADLAVATAALSDALGDPSPSETAVDACLEVEPTNGSVLTGLVLFDHREGTIREPLGEPPPAELVLVQPPGLVDTESFNRRLPRRVSAEVLDGWRRAFELCAAGIESGDLHALARAATSSAKLATHLGATPTPEAVERCAEATGALGWLRAHSGTVWSLIYPIGGAPDASEILEIWGGAPPPEQVSNVRLVRGGIGSSPALPSPCDAVILPPHIRGG